MGEGRRRRQARTASVRHRKAEIAKLEVERRKEHGPHPINGEHVPLSLTMRISIPLQDLLEMRLAEEHGDFKLRTRFGHLVARYLRGGMEGKLEQMVDDRISGAMAAIDWAPFLTEGDDVPDTPGDGRGDQGSEAARRNVEGPLPEVGRSYVVGGDEPADQLGG